MCKLIDLVPPLKDLEELLTEYSRLFQRFLLSGRTIESLSLEKSGSLSLADKRLRYYSLRSSAGWYIHLIPRQADSHRLLDTRLSETCWVHPDYTSIVDANLILRVREYVERLRNGEGFELGLWEAVGVSDYKSLGREELQLDPRTENAVTARTF